MFVLKDCHTPATCTEKALDRKAGAYTCRERIDWMIHNEGKPQWDACTAIAGSEYPEQCGPCDPTNSTSSEEDYGDTDTEATDSGESADCPACTEAECNSELNRCPIYERTVS